MNSFYLCNSAALEANLSRSAFKVYSYLAISANNKTRSSFKARVTIAKECKISVSTVVRTCKELCQKKLLIIKKRFDSNRRQTSNLYILLDNQQLSFDSQESQNGSFDTDHKVSSIPVKPSCKGSAGKARLFKCNSVAFHSVLTPNSLKVYSFLSLKADKEGKTMPAKKTIAASCGISFSTVTRAIKTLHRAGLIEIRRQTRLRTCGNNGTSVNLYILQPAEKFRKRATSLANFTIHRMYGKWPALPYHFTKRGLFIPSNDTLPRVTGDTPRTTSRMKATLKQRKKHFYSKLTKRIKHAILKNHYAENVLQGTG